jgi:hypothetical protein
MESAKLQSVTQVATPGGMEASLPKAQSRELISAALLTWAIRILLAYFGLRLAFLALSVSPFVPPDEVTHAGLCKVFSQVFWFPVNAPETFQFGLVTNSPWLYYWSMGKLLHLNFFGISDLQFLRILNLPLAFGSILFTWRTLLLLGQSRLSQLLLIVVLTNTPMFSLLSASVSYDNLTNLLAAMSIYYLCAFLKRRSGDLLAGALLTMLLGCLTKVSFLPLALALVIALFLHEWRNLRNLRALPGAVKAWLLPGATRPLWLLFLILIALGLNLQLYAGNYLRYNTLVPPMGAVLSPAAAMNYRLEARGTIFNAYKGGKISYMEALQLAGTIEHPGDKSDTFYLLMNYEGMKGHPERWMGPLAYSRYWYDTMLGTVLGIKGHLVMVKPASQLFPFTALLSLSCLGLALRWRPRLDGWLPALLLFVALTYSGYLMIEVNYDSYLNYGTPGLTLQGRYLLPILGPVYLIGCHFLARLFRRESLALALTLAAALLFIWGDFPWFLAHANAQWFGPVR